MSEMAKRIIIAVIAAPIILYSPFAGINYFAGLIFLISFLSCKEISVMYQNKKVSLNPLSPFTISVIPVIYLIAGPLVAFEYLLFIMLLLFTVDIFRSKDQYARIFSGYLIMAVYCGIFPSLLIWTVRSTSPWMFCFIYAVLIATDSFAYFGGMLCKKLFTTHKLLERVSPKKTIEGSITGFLFALISGVLLFTFTDLKTGMTLKDALVLSALISVFGQIGDLFESALKRDMGIKDSSNIIPGHGGVLDRFDSLIFASPAVYLYTQYILN
ncbi:MAG: phosphatidate cytidylyltransferase [Candidatus Delongbacteria bacterium]